MSLVFLDLRTNGNDPLADQIIQVGAVKVDGYEPELLADDYVQFYVDLSPGKYIPSKIVEKTGIVRKDLSGSPPLNLAKESILQFINKSDVVVYDASLILGFIQDVITPEFYCMRSMDYVLSPGEPHGIISMSERVGNPITEKDGSLRRAVVLWLLYNHYRESLGQAGVDVFKNKIASASDKPFKYTPPNAIIVK
jgi:hypothetical protein